MSNTGSTLKKVHVYQRFILSMLKNQQDCSYKRARVSHTHSLVSINCLFCLLSLQQKPKNDSIGNTIMYMQDIVSAHTWIILIKTSMITFLSGPWHEMEDRRWKKMLTLKNVKLINSLCKLWIYWPSMQKK